MSKVWWLIPVILETEAGEGLWFPAIEYCRGRLSLHNIKSPLTPKRETNKKHKERMKNREAEV